MPQWWNKLLGREPSPRPETTPTPAKWLAAEDPGNPFGVPLLDLMQLQGLISTSSDPKCAERAISWRGSTGDELDATALLPRAPIDCALRYPAAASLPDGILYAPPSMDFKWVLALRGGRLLAARSWTGSVDAVADATHDGETLLVERLRLTEDSILGQWGNTVEVFDWLIRVHVWDQRLPLPVGDSSAELLERVPLSGFSPFGKALFCAAKHWNPPPAPRPLRTDGEVIVAARLGDHTRLRRAVERGADLNAPGNVGGYTALHVAVIRSDLGLLEALLSLGASPEALGDHGMHALGLAVVHRAPLALFDALAETALDLALPNADGFTALHAAAEVDNADAVPWLQAHGLPLEARTRHGHTALHIAAALGNAAAAKALLAAGANRDASSPGGTPLDVARAENREELMTLLGARV